LASRRKPCAGPPKPASLPRSPEPGKGKVAVEQTYFFYDDYSEGAHPRILEALSRTNLQQERGYGVDSFALEAERSIKEKIASPQAQLHFVSSGTQANLVCIAAMLKPYESVIAPDNGHVNVHEAGAIEATGHRISTAPGVAGKLTPEAIQEILAAHPDEHTVKPRAVYISQATELGTIYSNRELRTLYELCQRNQLYLYIDGARIGNAVMAASADFALRDIAKMCDVLMIGGTKNGALIGEAVVIVNPDLQENFRRHLRQRGALLAKARAVSVQFAEMFRDDLYLENAKHANHMAQRLATGIAECGYGFLNQPITNQIFPILPTAICEKLQDRFGFYVWSKAPGRADSSVLRLVASWATREVAVQEFINDLKRSS
jgi:threonine aldolase